MLSFVTYTGFSAVVSSIFTTLTRSTFRKSVELILTECMESFEWGESDDSTVTLHKLVIKESAINEVLKSFGLRLRDSHSFSINLIKFKINWQVEMDLGILSCPWYIIVEDVNLSTVIDTTLDSVQLTEDSNDIHTNYLDEASSLQKILENAKIDFRNCIIRCEDPTGHHILLKFGEAQ